MRLLRQDSRGGPPGRRNDPLITVQLIDLDHLARPGVIGVYLLDGPEPALVDCGPAACLDTLLAGLAAHGLALTDLRHVLLTHIHPDHCGAAGHLVARHPALQVHVHGIGAPHLVDPARLEESARRLYGDAFDELFGPLAPVPPANVRVLAGSVLGLEVIPTPGHAPHHVSFLDPDGACYVGDTAGALVPPAGWIYPAAAPPGIDLPAWAASLDAIEQRCPTSLRLAHFGERGLPGAHLAELRERLARWADLIRSGASVERFVADARAELEAAGGDMLYVGTSFPALGLTYAGLARAVEKQTQSEGRTT